MLTVKSDLKICVLNVVCRVHKMVHNYVLVNVVATKQIALTSKVTFQNQVIQSFSKSIFLEKLSKEQLPLEKKIAVLFFVQPSPIILKFLLNTTR